MGNGESEAVNERDWEHRDGGGRGAERDVRGLDGP